MAYSLKKQDNPSSFIVLWSMKVSTANMFILIKINVSRQKVIKNLSRSIFQEPLKSSFLQARITAIEAYRQRQFPINGFCVSLDLIKNHPSVRLTFYWNSSLISPKTLLWIIRTIISEPITALSPAKW